LEIFAKKPIYLPEIAEYLKKQMPIDEVNFQKDIVDKLLLLTNVLKKISFIFALFLVIMSVVVMTTTTLFKIALKKDEIELLKLLGASNFYIKKPFLLEGFIYGLSSSLAALIILLGLLFYFQPLFSSYLRGLSNLVININSFQLTVWPVNEIFIGITFVLSSGFGIIIAMAATLLATGKYLKQTS
jgi:cell division transport system permease protein